MEDCICFKSGKFIVLRLTSLLSALFIAFLTLNSVNAQTSTDFSAGGSMKVGHDYRECTASLQGALRCSGYVPNAVEFDGADDFLLRNSTLNSVSSGKTLVGSFWIHINTGGLTHRIIDPGNNSEFKIEIDSSNRVNIHSGSWPGPDDLHLRSSPLSVGQWYHVAFSFDQAALTSHLYVNDSSDNSELIMTDTNSDFTETSWAIGARTTGADKTNASIADFWLDFETYIDLSVEANRRDFIDASGNPVYLGADGSLPTGSAPDVFLSGDTDNWHTNKGAGAGFDENGTLTTATSVPGGAVTDGLVGWWRLDETTGSTAFDSSGNGYNLTFVSPFGGGTFASNSASAIRGNGLTFTSNNDTLEASNANFALTTNYSMSVWAKIDPLVGRDVIFHKGNMNLHWNGQRLRFEIGAGSDNDGTDTYQDGWNHYVITYDGTTHNAYLNGALELSSTLAFTDSGDLAFGANYNPGDELTGIIDDARLYNRVLSSAEITALYNNSCPGGEPKYIQVCKIAGPSDLSTDLIAHWTLDETSGPAIADSTANNYDGTALDAFTYENGIINTAIDNRITIDTDDIFDAVTEGTLSLWVKWDGVNTNEISMFTQYNDTAGGNSSDYFQFNMQDGRLKFYGCSFGWTSPIALFTAGQWHHFVYHSDSTNGHKAYIDGVEVRSSATHAFFSNCNSVGHTTTYSIGHAQNAGENFDGPIDDVRIYDSVLTPEEIQQMYEFGWTNWGE